MSKISENLRLVKLRIENAARDHNRAHQHIRLLAVSKKHGAQSIVEAYNSGQRDFGENYLQEALGKISELEAYDIVWHFIGPIQSNKTRAIAEHFNWVHSVDRLKVAQRLNDQRPAGLPPLNVCIQVNIDDEASKSGITPATLDELAEKIEAMPNLQLRGLMAIPSAADPQPAFAQMQMLFDKMRDSQRFAHCDTLSMGMSGDLELAVAHASTIVRIGTDIFGARA